MSNTSHTPGSTEDEDVFSEWQIDESLRESFPASDPPPWTLGVKKEVKPSQDKGDDDQ